MNCIVCQKNTGIKFQLKEIAAAFCLCHLPLGMAPNYSCDFDIEFNNEDIEKETPVEAELSFNIT